MYIYINIYIYISKKSEYLLIETTLKYDGSCGGHTQVERAISASPSYPRSPLPVPVVQTAYAAQEYDLGLWFQLGSTSTWKNIVD